jgi:hypothetical protein
MQAQVRFVISNVSSAGQTILNLRSVAAQFSFLLGRASHSALKIRATKLKWRRLWWMAGLIHSGGVRVSALEEGSGYGDLRRAKIFTASASESALGGQGIEMVISTAPTSKRKSATLLFVGFSFLARILSLWDTHIGATNLGEIDKGFMVLASRGTTWEWKVIPPNTTWEPAAMTKGV